MIKLTANIYKNLINFKTSSLLINKNKSYFAKQTTKKGGKQQKKAEVPVVEQQPTQKLQPYEKLLNYFTPLQPGLSPSQTTYLNESFTDLPQQQKELLDQLAEKIAALNTPLFYNFVYKREGLGTSQAYFVGSTTYDEAQINQAIKKLRKDL